MLGLEQRRIGAEQRLVGVAETGVDLEWHAGPGRLDRVGEEERISAASRQPPRPLPPPRS